MRLAAKAPQPWWPPPPAGTDQDLGVPQGPAAAVYAAALGPGPGTPCVEALLARSQLLGGLLHSLLRPEYRDRERLQASVARYARYWALQLAYDQEALVPAADQMFIWLAHMSMAGSYRTSCRTMDPEARLLSPQHLELTGDAWDRAYARTKNLYEAAYGGELFDPPHTQYIPLYEPHPLAAPASVLTPLLRVFELRRPPLQVDTCAKSMQAQGLPVLTL
jgi:hypothetical protein